MNEKILEDTLDLYREVSGFKDSTREDVVNRFKVMNLEEPLSRATADFRNSRDSSKHILYGDLEEEPLNFP